MSFEYKPYLDEFFANEEQYYWELSQENGYFTNLAFIRHVMREHRGVYVRFLHSMLEDRGETYVFNLVHQAIGLRLSNNSPKFRYRQDKDSGVEDFDVFGTFKTDGVVVYHRTEEVQSI